jgi:hypothetical protein
MLRNDSFRFYIFFDPVNQGQERVKNIRAGTAANAVLHAWNHEQSSKLPCAIKFALLLNNRIVISNRLSWRDGWVAPAVVQDYFPAAVPEGRQIRACTFCPAAVHYKVCSCEVIAESAIWSASNVEAL